MRKAIILLHNQEARQLIEEDNGTYTFVYNDSYLSEPISLTMLVSQKIYSFNEFPPFFEGLLPEGIMLEGLLKIKKLDKKDYFSQLICVGTDMIGAATVQHIENE